MKYISQSETLQQKYDALVLESNQASASTVTERDEAVAELGSIKQLHEKKILKMAGKINKLEVSYLLCCCVVMVHMSCCRSKTFTIDNISVNTGSVQEFSCCERSSGRTAVQERGAKQAAGEQRKHGEEAPGAAESRQYEAQ